MSDLAPRAQERLYLLSINDDVVEVETPGGGAAAANGELWMPAALTVSVRIAPLPCIPKPKLSGYSAETLPRFEPVPFAPENAVNTTGLSSSEGTGHRRRRRKWMHSR